MPEYDNFTQGNESKPTAADDKQLEADFIAAICEQLILKN